MRVCMLMRLFVIVGVYMIVLLLMDSMLMCMYFSHRYFCNCHIL